MKKATMPLGERMGVDERVKKVEDAVLAVYKVHNPSYNPRQRANLAEHIARVSTVLKHAGLPSNLDGKSVLDVACGTGEYTIVYKALAASVTGVDLNEEAVALAKELFAANGYTARFFVESLFELDFPRGSFDVVSSLGTLHHTADPELGFHRLAQMLRPEGYFVLQIADAYGCWLRRFRRWLVIGLAGDVMDRRVWWAKTLWWNFLRRTEKFGGRSRDAVIYDWFVNPQHSFHTPTEICKWFGDAGLTLVGCYPTRAEITQAVGRLKLSSYCILHQRHHSQVWYVGRKTE